MIRRSLLVSSGRVFKQIGVNADAGGIGGGTLEDVLGNVGIVPNLKWDGSGSFAGFDVTGGLDIDLNVADATAPQAASIWGKLKKTIKNVGDITIRGDTDMTWAPGGGGGSSGGSDLSCSSIDLDATITTNDGTSISFSGYVDGLNAASKKPKKSSGFFASLFGSSSASSSTPEPPKFTFSGISIKRSLKLPGGGSVSVNPKYNFDVGSGFDVGNVQIGYGIGDDTSLKIDTKSKKLTMTHTFLTSNSISPSITADGDVSFTYTKTIPDGKVTTTYTPSKTLSVQYNDANSDWVTTVVAPLEGYIPKLDGGSLKGIKISTKRSVL